MVTTTLSGSSTRHGARLRMSTATDVHTTRSRRSLKTRARERASDLAEASLVGVRDFLDELGPPQAAPRWWEIRLDCPSVAVERDHSDSFEEVPGVALCASSACPHESSDRPADEVGRRLP